MTAQEPAGKELVKDSGRLFGHIIALVVGFAMMVAGIALGVTMVLLPLGLIVGFVGLGVFMWGLFGQAQRDNTPG